MNWIEIKEKYPKAYSLFKERHKYYFDGMHDDGSGLLMADSSGCLTYSVSDRICYDFFDEQELYIYPVPLGYDIVVFRVDHKVIKKRGVLPDRKMYETAAFTKAFEILEERLNSK